MAPPDGDPQGLSVDPDRFAEHLEVISAENHPVIAASELVDALSRRRMPSRAVAITFDDGYADNLTVAAPLLRRQAMPATVFVTTEWIESGRAAWWDELERHLRSDVSRPLHLRCGTWPAGDARERAAAYRELLTVLAGLTAAERERELAGLRSWSGSSASPDPGRRPLTSIELGQLANEPLIDIGGHTRAHSRLAALAPDEQLQEIVGGLDDLERSLGRRPRLFAYPFGARGVDYDRTTAQVASAAGIEAAFSTDPGPISRLSPALEMQRVLIGDLSADAFARRLRRAFRL